MPTRLTAFSVAWAVALAITTVFRKDLDAPFVSLYLLLQFAILAWGGVLAVVAIVNIVRHRTALAALLVLLAGYAGVHTARDYLSIDLRFAMAAARYERALQEALRGNGEQLDDLAGIEGAAPRQRVAFYWHRGVIDNWVGLVYDPSDSLKQPQWQSGQRSYFGGDLVSARHLRGHWYLCGFT